MKKIALLLITLLTTQLISTKYHAQYSQDAWINKNIFMNSKDLIFVDVGAADGINISNTLFFESELQWSGLCIEALPDQFKHLAKNRTCHCENACIGTTKKEVEFLVVTGGKRFEKSGADSRLFSGRADTWEPERKKLLQTLQHETIALTTIPLREILEKYEISHIDYLSIDVEGAESEVINSIDWNKTTVGVIEIENNCNTRESRDFLKKKGYVMVNRIATDDIWVNPEYILTQFPYSPVAAHLKAQ